MAGTVALPADPADVVTITRLRSVHGVGDRVRELRSRQGLTQQQLAAGNCSKEYISQIERGKTRPTRECLAWLAERLRVDLAYLESGISNSDYGRGEALVAQAEAELAGKRYADVIVTLRRFVAIPEAPELKLRACLAEGWARMYEGELKGALELFEEARRLAVAAELGLLMQADAAFRIGCCRYKLSSIGIAIDLFTEALALTEASGLPCDRLRADILGWRSRCHRRQRDWVSARDDVERALELSRALHDPELEANTLFQASLVEEREGHWLLARRLAEQAKELYQEIGDRVNVGRQLNNLGGFEFLLGNTDRAVERLHQAFELATEIGSTPDAAQALCSLAEVELSTADYAPAEEHARHALALLDGRPDFLDVAGAAQLRLGKALLEQERLDEAESTFQAAETTLGQLSSASHLAAAWSAQGELALKRGDTAQAATLYRRATEALQDYCF